MTSAIREGRAGGGGGGQGSSGDRKRVTDTHGAFLSIDHGGHLCWDVSGSVLQQETVMGSRDAVFSHSQTSQNTTKPVAPQCLTFNAL